MDVRLQVRTFDWAVIYFSSKFGILGFIGSTPPVDPMTATPVYRMIRRPEVIGKALVDTQLSMAIPPGYYGRIAPRSGLASKSMIDIGAGVIDADYRGIVKVLLFNFSESDFAINPGDRIAQLILERIGMPSVQEVTQLDDTVRGNQGFGSTGIHGAIETLA